MSLQSVNLNLLPLMRALFKHRSVTLAARSLDISQSAASQGLGRLREQMNDPLLVRISGRMELTPLARALTAKVESVTSELDELFLASRFDPRRAKRTFVIAANDYMALNMARPLLDLQRAEAPDIRIRFIEIGSDFTDRMAAQDIDFALMPRFAARDLTVAPLRYRLLRTERAGVMMDRSHPLAAKEIVSEADLAPYEYVAFHTEALEHNPPKHVQTPVEIATCWEPVREVAMHTNHFTVLPSLICGTELVAIVPFSLGQEMSRIWPTEMRRLSFGPEGVDHVIAWSPVFDADPAHIWLRTQIENRLSGSSLQTHTGKGQGFATTPVDAFATRSTH